MFLPRLFCLAYDLDKSFALPEPRFSQFKGGDSSTSQRKRLLKIICKTAMATACGWWVLFIVLALLLLYSLYFFVTLFLCP